MKNESLDEQHQFEELIQGLIDNDYGYCNHFILPSTVIGLSANIKRLQDSGLMKSAGIGQKNTFIEDKSIRGDIINWITEETTNPFEIIYLKKIKNLILYLNSTCFTSIKTHESHYATYEKKSIYKRHIDQFKSEKGRKYSIVLYLNQEWEEEDGGVLSLYPKNKGIINITPLAGRVVLFRSDEMEHEVHASFTKDRKSIASWLKN